MKLNKSLFLTLIVATLATLFVACGGDDTSEIQLKVDTQAIKEKMDEQVNRLDAKINELQGELEEASEDSKDAINEQIEHLKGLKETVVRNSESLGEATADKLQQIQSDFDGMMEEINQAISESFENEGKA
ncbi:MAG TPA: hypothetical protein PKV71_12665 [Calditrichia bacterium]|nr:hypothetical protein [Calditrichota bacterium]HQV32728.1 hypothetical protein [Calditrichia bacterium]